MCGSQAPKRCQHGTIHYTHPHVGTDLEPLIVYHLYIWNLSVFFNQRVDDPPTHQRSLTERRGLFWHLLYTHLHSIMTALSQTLNIDSKVSQSQLYT